MLIRIMLYLPFAVMPLSVISTVISVDDGLLRAKTTCRYPIFSSTLNTDWLKETLVTIKQNTLVNNSKGYRVAI